jgi:hypothetical protein
MERGLGNANESESKTARPEFSRMRGVFERLAKNRAGKFQRVLRSCFGTGLALRMGVLPR